MRDDDKRHSTVAGYRAGCRDTCCKRAIASYNQLRKHRLDRGEQFGYISSLGTARRLQALVALGWTARRLSMLMNKDPSYVRILLQREEGRVAQSTADEVDRLYKRLCMTPPTISDKNDKQSVTVAKRIAAENQWVPPLGWDDIDTDPYPVMKISQFYAENKTRQSEVDEVNVHRAVHLGRFTATFTAAEKRAITASWRRLGRPMVELERLSGWNVHRYTAASGDEEAA